MGRITGGVKKFVKPLVNFPLWMSWDRLQEGKNYLVGLFQDIFVIQKLEEHERHGSKKAFAALAKRLSLTPEKLAKRDREYTTLIRVYVLAYIGVWAYTIHLISAGFWRAAIIGVAVSFLLIGMWFRVHFWRFQLRERKLGCGFREWLHVAILKKR